MNRTEPQIIDYYRRLNTMSKSQRIYSWKYQGVFSQDWEKTYCTFMNSSCCEECGITFTYGKKSKTTKVLDHDHKIQGSHNIRNILCMSCNSKRQ